MADKKKAKGIKANRGPVRPKTTVPYAPGNIKLSKKEFVKQREESEARDRHMKRAGEEFDKSKADKKAEAKEKAKAKANAKK